MALPLKGIIRRSESDGWEKLTLEIHFDDGTVEYDSAYRVGNPHSRPEILEKFNVKLHHMKDAVVKVFDFTTGKYI